VNRLPDSLTSEHSYACFHRQPVSSKEKADLIIFDPPYFDKKAGDYSMKLGLLQNSRFDIHIKSLLSSDDRSASHFTFQAWPFPTENITTA
jgi:16S rRNA G966 N2-methylase RsmD